MGSHSGALRRTAGEGSARTGPIPHSGDSQCYETPPAAARDGMRGRRGTPRCDVSGSEKGRNKRGSTSVRRHACTQALQCVRTLSLTFTLKKIKNKKNYR